MLGSVVFTTYPSVVFTTPIDVNIKEMLISVKNIVF
jgi:hypothetical protein